MINKSGLTEILNICWDEQRTLS